MPSEFVLSVLLAITNIVACILAVKLLKSREKIEAILIERDRREGLHELYVKGTDKSLKNVQEMLQLSMNASIKYLKAVKYAAPDSKTREWADSEIKTIQKTLEHRVDVWVEQYAEKSVDE